MASHTIELKYVIDDVFGTSLDKDDFEQSYHEVTFAGIKYGKLPFVEDWSKIGLGHYPIFNEAYRDVLNGKIVDHYFNREIGSETIEVFIQRLRSKMNVIMPYYNQLYESLEIPYDALTTMDIHSVSTAEIESDETGTSVSENESETLGESRAVNSETPQTMLSGDEDYATAASDSKSESVVTGKGEASSNSSSNTTNNSDNRVTGFQGISSDLVTRYRSSLINIDEMILEQLVTLFMLIIGNSDNYFKRGFYI